MKGLKVTKGIGSTAIEFELAPLYFSKDAESTPFAFLVLNAAPFATY